MVRTQIQLTERQASEMKKRAARQNISMAEVIRRALDEYIARQTPKDEDWERARSAIGCFKSGLGDLSENHDKYAVEAYLN